MGVRGTLIANIGRNTRQADELTALDLNGEGRPNGRPSLSSNNRKGYEHPVVLPQVSHFMQVPFRTSVKLAHSLHISPS